MVSVLAAVESEGVCKSTSFLEQPKKVVFLSSGAGGSGSDRSVWWVSFGFWF